LIIRASIGTLAVLNLVKIQMEVAPKTAFLLQYSREGCMASCSYCSQSRTNKASKEWLSRVKWPSIELDAFIKSMNGKRVFERICFQTIMKKGFVSEAMEAVKKLSQTEIPISLAITPVGFETLTEFREAGVDMLGVGLDAASPRVFRVVEKPFSWEIYHDFIKKAVDIFGERRVYVHIIIGLGESETEAGVEMEKLYSLGAEVALFAFTPMKGVRFKATPPDICYYRRMQALRWFLSKGYSLREVVSIENERIRFHDSLLNEVEDDMLLTSGCPSCNRPFYNEAPGTILYNYPSKKLLPKERKWVECLR